MILSTVLVFVVLTILCVVCVAYAASDILEDDKRSQGFAARLDDGGE